MKIHIPDESVEAAALEIYEHSGTLTLRYCREIARATITAALEAWTATGMAKEGRQGITDDGIVWLANSLPPDLPGHHRCLIIRTEAE